MAALAFLTAVAALAVAPALSTTVPELPAVHSGDTRISAAVLAERIEAAVTALEMELSVNCLIRLAGGGLARLAGGVLFLLPPAAAAPSGAEGTGGRAAVDDDAAGGPQEVGVDARRRGGGWNGPVMATSGDVSADAAAAEGAADGRDSARDDAGICARGSADDGDGLGGHDGGAPPPSGPASAEARVPFWLMV